MKTLTTIILALIFTFGVSDITAQDTWLRTYNDTLSNYDQAIHHTTDLNGNIYVTGYTSNPTDGLKGLTLKYSPTGALLWKRTFSTVGVGVYGRKVLIDQQGLVYVFMTYSMSGIDDVYMVKYDNNGNVVRVMLVGTPNVDEKFADASLDNNGNVFLALNCAVTGNDTDIKIFKYSNQLQLITSKTYTGSGRENASKILVNQFNDVYIVGTTTSNPGAGIGDILVLRYDTQLAYFYNYIWSSPNSYESIGSSCLTPDGGLVITGSSNVNGKYDFLMIRLHNNLQLQWMNVYSASPVSTGFGDDVAVDNLNKVYICGSENSNSNTDAAVMKLDGQSGSVEWYKKYSRGSANEIAGSIGIDGSRNVYIAGISNSSDAMVLKYDNNGNLLFEYNYNGTANGNDGFESLTVSPDGKFCATGAAITSTNGDALIVKINTSTMTGITGAENEIPSDYSLSQNYPNPFNPSTKISFSIPKASFVKMAVYDITGREVETLVNEQLNAGTFEVDFNASKLTSGVYFYRISAEDFVETRKMILTK
jgi:hypothetical protein